MAPSLRVTVDGGTDRWLDYLDGAELAPPDLISGDMDSITTAAAQHYKSRGAVFVETPDQDETDFTKALRLVRRHAVKANIQLDGIIALADTSGRLDHILANVHTLYKAADDICPDLPVYQLANDSLSWLLPGGAHRLLVPAHLRATWCSLVPVGAPSDSVTTTGLRWNLTDHRMNFGGLVSTSNTYDESEVSVRTDSPVLWSMAWT